MCRRLIASCCSALAAAVCLAGAALGQGQAIPSSATPIVGGQAAAGVPPRVMLSHGPLSGVLDKMVWDPETRGTLLVVSPDTTKEAMIPVASEYGSGSYMSGPLLEPDARSLYQMNQIEEHYDRRLVRLHTISVLAPAKMTILKASGFPKPDAYAGMDQGAKAKLLMSTLSPDQWRALASPTGLGVDDLKRSQTEIFLAMLPEPFRVSSVGPTVVGASRHAANVGVALRQDATTLTDEQRSAVRLTLNKTIDWSHPTHSRGNIQLGNGEQASGASLRVGESVGMFGPEAFGVPLTEQVSARSKPSDLAYDAGTLDVDISLTDVKTVGDLVQSIATKTHAELYCDPRYRSRTVAIRGASAQAGDVLHALAWAVTGAWRRVGPAFILTDDVVGLGVRHGIIGNWLQENALLGELRERNVDAALRAAHAGDYLNWSNSDPNKPSEALVAKINAFEKASSLETNPADPRPRQLDVPLTDLTPAAQGLALRQVDSYTNGLGVSMPHMPAALDVRTDAVTISVVVHAAFLIPGMGMADASSITDRAIGDVLLNRPQRLAARPGDDTAAVRPDAIAFPEKTAARALILTPSQGDSVEIVARLAKEHGFNELWVQVPRGDTEVIASAVRVGAKYSLAVRPVIGLLDADSKEKPERLDRNLLGETVTEHVSAWRGRLAGIGLPDEIPGVADAPPVFAEFSDFATLWPDIPAEKTMVQFGDFLRCDQPEIESKVVDEIVKTATVSGIAGIVVRDLAASGYTTIMQTMGLNRPRQSSMARDPFLTMGYTETMRLGFLRSNGLDPIDLSPLLMGNARKSQSRLGE